MDHNPALDRFDSAALLSIFKVEDGENLLPFEEMAALLELGELDVPAPFTGTAPVVTTEGPAMPANGNGQVLPSTSGGADSDRTRAPDWGSRPSSRPSSEGGADSDDSADVDTHQQVSQLPEQLPHPYDHRKQEQLPEPMEMETQPSSTFTADFSGGGDGEHHHHEEQRQQRPQRTRGGGSGGRAGRVDTSKATSSSGVKKRRQRNAEQMESNRVAQQKYRHRKKQEQSALQQAVDLLTAQVAALKAVEVRAGELEASNSALQDTVRQQADSIAALQQAAAAQAAQLESARADLSSSQAQVAAQGKHILDQQAKLRLQEQVIVSLKDRLKESIDEAMEHVVPGTVCEKMVAAVKATLYGAKDVHGLQETLAQLPDHLVIEICKNIFHVCKESWPDMRARCSQQAGGSSCMTGAA